IAILSGLDDDLRGNALDDLYVVAGRVLRRKQTEKRPRRPGDAVDMALVRPAAGIDVDLDRLAGTDRPKLRLLEVRGDPDVIKRDDGQQLLPRLHVHADHDGLGDLPGHRSDDPRVSKIQPRLLERGTLLLHGGLRGQRARTRRRHLPWRRLRGAVV